jgi:preprotein translocase subunit SecD
MRKNLTTKTIAIFAVLIFFVFGIIGLPHGFSGSALKNSILDRIHLGLDLKGGTHLILQVMVDEAVGITTDSDAAHIQQDLQQNGITVGSVAKADPNRPDTILISGAPADRSGDIRTILNSKYGAQYDISSGANNTWTLTMKPSAVAEIRNRALEQAIEVIRTRVDSLGVSEPVIQEYNLGSDQILVELPGVDDPARVKDVIQSTARLEIHAVLGGPYTSEQEAIQQLGGAVPLDSEIVPTAAGVSRTGGVQYYQIKRAPEIGGTDLRSARVGQNQNTNEPEVDFFLTTTAGDHFAEFTGANKGKYLAVVLDNKIREVAVIRDQIRDQGNISGGMTSQQANDLAMLLNTGSLPASLHYLQESTVGPSLGADSIHQGVMASIIGMLAVMVFMLIYYRGAGINADLALFLNLVILLGFMGFTGSTLTLPGIAGVILTIGMGVDSNVLIFERIREEVRAGKTPAVAVEQGFGHAWTTIIDTHVTTIVSAAILFIFGTGPVRGFAVTLTFGLLANLFTAVFVSRVIFDANLNRKQRGEALSI